MESKFEELRDVYLNHLNHFLTHASSISPSSLQTYIKIRKVLLGQYKINPNLLGNIEKVLKKVYDCVESKACDLEDNVGRKSSSGESAQNEIQSSSTEEFNDGKEQKGSLSQIDSDILSFVSTISEKVKSGELNSNQKQLICNMMKSDSFKSISDITDSEASAAQQATSASSESTSSESSYYDQLVQEPKYRYRGKITRKRLNFDNLEESNYIKRHNTRGSLKLKNDNSSSLLELGMYIFILIINFFVIFHLSFQK